MRNLKKVLALVLAMAMSLSLAVTAGAAYKTFPDQDKIENQEAVFLLNALDIVEGRETGDFDPAANINRAEAAKLVAALNLAGVPVPNAKGVSSFSDVLGDGSVAWANNYIEYGVSQGSINGMGDGTFAPKANVTGVQFAKMLLGILGYDAAEEGYTGTNWMYNVNIDAVDAGLYRGLDIDATAALSRDDAAQMMYNALKAKTVIYLTDTTGALKLTDKNLLETIYPTVKGNQGIMTSISYNTDKAEYTYFIDGEKVDKTLKTSVDYTDMLGMNVMWVNDEVEGVLGIYAYKNGAVVEGLWGDFDKDQLTKDELVDTYTEYKYFESIGNAFDLKDAAKVTENNDPHCYYEYKAIDNDNSGVYDIVIVYPVDIFGSVAKVGSKSITLTNSNELKFEENTIYSGVAAKDEVTREYDTTLKTELVINELTELSGKVDSFRGDSAGAYEITISGTTYDVSCELARQIDTFYTGKFVNFQVINGYVVDIAIDNSVAFSQFLMVTSIDDSRNLDGSYTAQALMADGTPAEINISKLVGFGTEKAIYDEISKFLQQRLPAGEVDQRGYVAKYDVVDGNYELTPIHKLPNPEAMGFTHFGWDLKFNAAYNNTLDATIKLNGRDYMIADDAIIYLVDVSGDKPVYSIATGADIKHITGKTAVYFAGTELDETTGYESVTFAHVVTNNMQKSAVMTGILTTDVKVYSGTDGEYAYFTMWDGEKDVTMNVELDSMVGEKLGKLDAGTAIWFRVDAGMIVEGDTCFAGNELQKGAVTAYIAGDDLIYIDNIPYVITEDTEIYFYDMSEKAGVADGTITLGTPVDATDLTKGRYDNVAFKAIGNVIGLMVVDTDVDGDTNFDALK